MHYDYEALPWAEQETNPGWKHASITLDRGDTAMQPGSTKRVIHGPAVVVYTQAPDGGINADIANTPVDNTALIATMQDAIETAREALDDFRRHQDEDSDEANEDHIQSATAALDAFEGHVGDLVP